MINYLKDCQKTTLIGQLPDIINSNNNSIRNEFNWIFDSSLNRLTKSVYAPTGSVKSHFGEFVNLSCEYITIKNLDSLFNKIISNSSLLDHNSLGNRFYNSLYNDLHNFSHDATSILYKRDGDNYITVYDAISSANGSPFDFGIGQYSVIQKGGNNNASGNYSVAEGLNTITSNTGEHAEGKFNISNINTIHSIGIGENSNNRKNAVEVLNDGSTYIYGIGGYNGMNQDVAYTLQQYIATLEARIEQLEQEIRGGSPISHMTEIDESTNYLISPTPLSINSSEYIEMPNANVNNEGYLI